MPASKSIQRIIALSLRILTEAAYKGRTHRQDTTEVRLALAVLARILKDRAPLIAFWERVTSVEARDPWDTCHPHYRMIELALENEGWDAQAHEPTVPPG